MCIYLSLSGLLIMGGGESDLVVARELWRPFFTDADGWRSICFPLCFRDSYNSNYENLIQYLEPRNSNAVKLISVTTSWWKCLFTNFFSLRTFSRKKQFICTFTYFLYILLLAKFLYKFFLVFLINCTINFSLANCFRVSKV